MIRHLRHSEIDKSWWDRRLLACSNRLWYAQSWVLDIASPGWEALVAEETGSIMPLTCRRKYGVRYLFQPFGLQQLGIFAPAAIDAVTVRAFLKAVPPAFRLVDIHGNEGMPGVPEPGWDLGPRRNRTITCSGTVDDLRSAYSTGHRRNLKQAGAGIVVPVGVEAFTELFARTIVRRFGPFDRRGLEAMPALLAIARERRQLELTGITEGTEIVAALCVLRWTNRDILFKSAADERGREQRAMFQLIDHHLRSMAGSGRVFDLAGSNDEATDRFYAGFGAAGSTYFRLRRNTLPAWVRKLNP